MDMVQQLPVVVGYCVIKTLLQHTAKVHATFRHPVVVPVYLSCHLLGIASTIVVVDTIAPIQEVVLVLLNNIQFLVDFLLTQTKMVIRIMPSIVRTIIVMESATRLTDHAFR